jgi:hypothetical protein
MKVVIYSSLDEDSIEHQRMEIDGKVRMHVGRPEPEDAIIGRDLVPCTEIAALMREAHAAANRGEAFEIETKEEVPA